MLIFRAHNHFGDTLCQLGLLKMLHEQRGDKIGFIVKNLLQYKAIETADFLELNGIISNGMPSFRTGPQDILRSFIADEDARFNNVSLIDMWAKSIPFDLQGEKKPFIRLIDKDYEEAHKLKLQGKTFVAPFIRACDFEKETSEGQDYLRRKFENKGVYLLGAKGDPRWAGFKCLFGLPIRVVGVLLQEANKLYCVSNGITILAWAVGLKRIYEWTTPLRSWARVPYSQIINP